MSMQVGQQVKLAVMPDVIFKIIKQNADGSFEVEAHFGNQHISYGNIAPEMLRLVHHSA